MSPQLVVADLDISLEFYTKKLGFEIDFRYEDFYVGISRDNCSIHLKTAEDYSGEKKRVMGANQDVDLVFSVFVIDELYEALSREPIDMVQPMRQMPYGKEFYIADPDGYRLAFISAE